MPRRKVVGDAPPTVQQAFRLALVPPPAHERAFASHAGGARYAYNWAVARVAEMLDAYNAAKEAGEDPESVNRSAFALCPQWTAYKEAHKTEPDARGRTTEWVSENFVGTYQAAIRDAARAWDNFFKSRSGRRKGRKMGRPRFKSRARTPLAFQTHGGVKMLDKSHIYLPKIGSVRIAGMVRVGAHLDRNGRVARKLMRLIRQDRARIVRATISRGASGTWWCSVTVEVQRALPTTPTHRQRAGGTVGLDLGVRYLAVASTGEIIPNPGHLQQALARLATYQRHMARATPGSRRYNYWRRQAGILHEETALRRKVSLDPITSRYACSYEHVVTEGWDAQRLAEKGSAKLPRAIRKTRNQQLAGAAPGMMRWQLQYKCLWRGSRYTMTDPHETTGRTCSQCGQAKTKPVNPADDMFACQYCGYRADRRLNTAVHLARRGRELAAKSAAADSRGGDVRPGGASGSKRHSPAKRDTRTRSP